MTSQYVAMLANSSSLLGHPFFCNFGLSFVNAAMYSLNSKYPLREVSASSNHMASSRDAGQSSKDCPNG
eukprot:CAMPEP_0169161728 /NCGR_PEP_ID=MMETSP1015-20121227/57213_1 /TAXON_ID=342587 /ORGANISM="Karlodinium micrum, Strain CCMP2283" /LENGTH=68 /DNA_ID=CAMNT_0009233631 /DNA_START=365 /DNA_END=568 /DNA_ORIENTATION=-